MKTHGYCFALVVLAAGGCAGAADNDDLSTTPTEAALSAVQDRFALLRHDRRECTSPACGGFLVHELNRGTEMYVTDVQLAVPDAEVDRLVRSAPDGELVVRGHLDALPTETRSPLFVVTEAYRGMPGASAGRADAYFTISGLDCTPNSCARFLAIWLNLTEPMPVASLDLTRATAPWADAAWLRDRVIADGALVAGALDGDRLDVGQVFVRLPDSPVGPCPTLAAASCTEGSVATFTREGGRCLVPTGCSRPGECLMHLPACDAGYTLHTWMTGEPACPAYACDPTFLSHP